MNKLADVSKIRQLAKDTKGATMVEYALMLFLILVICAALITKLGKSTNDAYDKANTTLQ
jgi:Flp pilus assembly pilin Flp